MKEKTIILFFIAAAALGILLVFKPSAPAKPEIVEARDGKALYQSAGSLPYSAAFGSKAESNQAPTKIAVGKTSMTITPETEVKEIKKQGRDKITVITLDGAKFIQTLKQTGIKEDIIIQKAIDKIVFNADLEAITPRQIKGLWRFLDDQGQEQFFIPQPFMTDSKGVKSEAVALMIVPVEGANYQITITPDEDWLADPTRVYPITIDPSIELTILNVHSHPQTGDDWTVSFETKGAADLTITPDDQATIDDLDFVSLTCDDQERTPQILENDVVFYPNWFCENTGEIIHLVNVAGNHTLKFQF